MISYTVSCTLYVPESIPRDAVEQALLQACGEFRVGNSKLLPIDFSVTAKKVGP